MGNGQSSEASPQQLLNQRQALTSIPKDIRPAVIQACDGIPIDELNAFLESQKNEDGKIVLRRFMHRDIFTTYTSNHKVPQSIRFRESYLVHRDDYMLEDKQPVLEPIMPTKLAPASASIAVPGVRDPDTLAHAKRISCDTFGSFTSDSELSEDRDYSTPSSNQSSPRVRFRPFVEYYYQPSSYSYGDDERERQGQGLLNLKPEKVPYLGPPESAIYKAAAVNSPSKNRRPHETTVIIPEHRNIGDPFSDDGLSPVKSGSSSSNTNNTNGSGSNSGSSVSGSPKKTYNRLITRIKSQKQHKLAFGEDSLQEGLPLCIDSPIDSDDSNTSDSTTTTKTTKAAENSGSRRRFTMADMEEFDFSSACDKDEFNFNITNNTNNSSAPRLTSKPSFDRYASHQANPEQVNKVSTLTKYGRYVATKGSIKHQSLPTPVDNSWSPPPQSRHHQRTDSVNSSDTRSSMSVIDAGIPPRVPPHEVAPRRAGAGHGYSYSEGEISVHSIITSSSNSTTSEKLLGDKGASHRNNESGYTRKCSYKRSQGAQKSKPTTSEAIKEEDELDPEAMAELDKKAFMLSGYKPSCTKLYVTNPDAGKPSLQAKDKAQDQDSESAPESQSQSVSALTSLSSPKSLYNYTGGSLLDLYLDDSEDIWTDRAQQFAAKVKI